MRRVPGALLLLVGLLQGAAACDLGNLTACSTAQGLQFEACKESKDREDCCLGAATLENCLVNYGAGCVGATAAAEVSTFKDQIEAWRTYLTATLGIECQKGLGTPTTTVNLLSGDSASSSSGSSLGSSLSGRSGSSGSGFLYWQWIVLICLCCACCGGGGGGAYAYMGKKKTRGKGKGSRQNEEDYMQSGPVPIEQEMPAMDGEPQAEMGMQEPLVEQSELPPLEPIAGATPEVQPLLFGPTPGLLSGPTGSTITTGMPVSYSYAGVLPTTTSQYTTGYYQQAAQPIYTTSTLNYAQPIAGSYSYGTGAVGAFGTMPLGTIPPAGFVVEGQPTYATTDYATEAVVG